MSSYILGYISKQISWTFEYANWSDNFSRFTHDEGLLYVDQSPGGELTTPQILDFLVKAGRGLIPTRDQPIQDIHELYPQQQVWPPTHFTVRTTNMYVLLRKLLNYYPMANQEHRHLWKREGSTIYCVIDHPWYTQADGDKSRVVYVFKKSKDESDGSKGWWDDGETWARLNNIDQVWTLKQLVLLVKNNWDVHQQINITLVIIQDVYPFWA